jgi:hypothetical protein
MSFAKRLMERHDEQRSAAMRIALQAGALKRCEFHEDCVFEGDHDIEGAYRLGNSMFSRGELREIVDSRKEMTDCIKDVVEDHRGDECPRCAKFRDE